MVQDGTVLGETKSHLILLPQLKFCYTVNVLRANEIGTIYSVYNSKEGLTLSIDRMRRNARTTTIIWPKQNCYDLQISFQAVYHEVKEWYIHRLLVILDWRGCRVV
jgi:hypothetical protein